MKFRYVKNHLWKTAGHLFKEIESWSEVKQNSLALAWLIYKIYKLAAQTAKTVLCLDKTRNNPDALKKKQNPMISGQQLFQRLESNWWTTNRIQVKDFPQTHNNGNPQSVSSDDGRITVWTRERHKHDLFMSMFHDIVWDAKGTDELCENNSKTIKQHARGFSRGHWSFQGPSSEKKWYGTYDPKSDGS